MRILRYAGACLAVVTVGATTGASTVVTAVEDGTTTVTGASRSSPSSARIASLSARVAGRPKGTNSTGIGGAMRAGL